MYVTRKQSTHFVADPNIPNGTGLCMCELCGFQWCGANSRKDQWGSFCEEGPMGQFLGGRTNGAVSLKDKWGSFRAGSMELFLGRNARITSGHSFWEEGPTDHCFWEEGPKGQLLRRNARITTGHCSLHRLAKCSHQAAAVLPPMKEYEKTVQHTLFLQILR